MEDQAHVHLRWRTVALAALAVAIAAIAALVVLHGSKSQALESTAILLAIIAFIVQLMVFIAQAIQSNASAVRLEQIAGELSANLGITREQLGAMGTELRELRQSQTDLALRVAADQTAEDLAERPTNDPHEIAARIRELAEAVLDEQQRGAGPQSRFGPESGTMPSRSLDRLGHPTTEERQRSEPVLASLSDDAFAEFVRIKAIDNTIPRHQTKGAWSDREPLDPVLKELESARLIRVWDGLPADRQQRGVTFVQLEAPLGLEAGRVVHSDGFLRSYLDKRPTTNTYRHTGPEPNEDATPDGN